MCCAYDTCCVDLPWNVIPWQMGGGDTVGVYALYGTRWVPISPSLLGSVVVSQPGLRVSSGGRTTVVGVLSGGPALVPGLGQPETGLRFS